MLEGRRFGQNLGQKFPSGAVDVVDGLVVDDDADGGTRQVGVVVRKHEGSISGFEYWGDARNEGMCPAINLENVTRLAKVILQLVEYLEMP